MRRSSEEGYAVFRWIGNLVTRHYKALVVLWVVIFAGALVANQIWPLDNVVSYSQTDLLPKDTESARAQNLYDAQFGGQQANDSATIVLVANDTTTQYYRWFVTDLNDAIVASSQLQAGENVTFVPRYGSNVTLDKPIRYLGDAGNATIYAVYENFAYKLAKEFAPAVHAQALFGESAVGVYWGVPAYFLGQWLQTFGASANETAFNATVAFINGTFPAEGQPWALGYLQVYDQAWLQSFSNPGLDAADASVRTETVIDLAIPAFLSTAGAQALFPPEAIAFQEGLVGQFGLLNFTDTVHVDAVALQPFTAAAVARLPFFLDLNAGVNATPTDAALHAFARDEVLAYDLNATPLVLPYNVTKFYVSPDRTIMLLNYEFTQGEGYRDASGTQPVADDVLAIRELAARLKAAYGARASIYVTGSAPSSLDSEKTFGGTDEFVVTVVLVIILIGLYFRSAVSPALPILTIGVAIMLANLWVYFVAADVKLTISYIVTAVLQTVLLAVGTDYSIFLISRYRDERQDGHERKEAVRNAVVWAGESVTTSGGAVLISFAALAAGSFPLIRTLGIALGAAVTIALGLALSFIPSLLNLMGNSVFFPSGQKVTQKRPKDPAHWTRTERYFHRAATTSMDHAKIVLVLAILLTIPAVYIVVTDQPTYDFTAGAPPTDSGDGLNAISGSFGYGFIFPSFILVQFPSPVLLSDGNYSVPALEAVNNLSTRLLAMESGVKSTEGPTNPQGVSIDYRNLSTMPLAQQTTLKLAVKPYIGEDKSTVRISLILRDDPFSVAALNTIDRLKPDVAEIQGTEPGLATATVLVGGVTPTLNDVRHNMDHDLQIMAIIVIAGLFTVLLFVLGSVLIPIRAILTILLSISWTLALTIVLFHVWKDIDIIFILTLALFVMAMGLGMDYDIFIITRVREEVAKGKSDREAIAEATTRTGGIISACGIVMAGAFATLMLNPSPFLQQIGFALAFAILLDSMVVRIYLVPAIMVLAGRGNWWAPGPLQRVHRDQKAKAPKPTPAQDIDD